LDRSTSIWMHVSISQESKQFLSSNISFIDWSSLFPIQQHKFHWLV
jgi:hypothetical protein